MIPPIASRFVAGETPAEALSHVRDANDRGLKVILNLLGEHYAERGPADEDADAYCRLIEDIDREGLEACVSVKPSQLGLDVGVDVFRENLARVVENGTEHERFVWMDMEDRTATDATIDAFETFARQTDGGVGVCLQANLKRTAADVERLADVPGKIRLVKGAYNEPSEVAFRRIERVNRAFEERLEELFRRYVGTVAVGSHDPAMIDRARELHDEYGTPFEIQMLMGVREDAQVALAEECEVWQYVPYGDRWLSYFTRRVTERKENVLFALRAIVGR